VDASRPILHVLVCRYVDGRWTWDYIALQHWHTARAEFLAAGWWFVGVDPQDECDITRAAQLERSRLKQI
jgi:hypothetical protein